MANDPVRLFLYTAKLSALTGRSIATGEVKEALIKGVDHYTSPEGKKALYVNDIDRATKSLSAHLVELNWSTTRSSSGDDFFLSDTPVISRATDNFGRVSFGVGIGQSAAEWILPISPRMALRVAHRPRNSNHIDAVEMAQLNGGQIYTMSKRLYGRAYSLWIDEMVQRHAGTYQFHVDVFKGSGFVREDGFDDVMAGLPQFTELMQLRRKSPSLRGASFPAETKQNSD
jgi:hypothetical protein